MLDNPVAIGAIGGSGTRVVAQLLMQVGYFMGSNLNKSNDNLEFTSRFKNIEILNASDTLFAGLVNDFFSLMRFSATESKSIGWGWKEPNTHVVASRLLDMHSGLRYVHVLRNGFDMAHSKNQNQPRLWGEAYLSLRCDGAVTPRYSLKYWCEVHRRVSRIANNPSYASRVHFLTYENICRNPENTILKLFEFLGYQLSSSELQSCVQLINPPDTVGRWREYGLDLFDSEDVEYIKSIGGLNVGVD